MPIFDYVLLALLTSGGHAPGDVTLTLGPQAIVQPNGGVSVVLAANRSGQTHSNSSSKPIKANSGSAGATSSTTSKASSNTTLFKEDVSPSFARTKLGTQH